MTPDIDVLVIGGTGFYDLPALGDARQITLDTPFGPPSSPLKVGVMGARKVAFLARHGLDHEWLPHQVNYRANVYTARLIGARSIVAIHAVGSMNRDLPPGCILLPDQLVDYTWGRDHTYATDIDIAERHVDLTCPFDEPLRQSLAQGALQCAGGTSLASQQATYAVTQGPRLESAAEISRLGRDGCDVVGMTAMPEAGLARELQVALASIAVVANWAAGFAATTSISMEQVLANIEQGSQSIRDLLGAWCDLPAVER